MLIHVEDDEIAGEVGKSISSYVCGFTLPDTVGEYLTILKVKQKENAAINKSYEDSALIQDNTDADSKPYIRDSIALAPILNFTLQMAIRMVKSTAHWETK